MHDGSQGNAMTEIALALAMGFFSIMVLTMVSMGVDARDSVRTAAAVLAPEKTAAGGPGTTEVAAEDRVVVFHGGRYLDSDMHPVDPAALSGPGRVVLAIDPGLPLAQAMAARLRVKSDNLIVTTLDDRWIQALARDGVK
ncbi:MAG: hypothetical protein H6907_03280 [Hyphomicrobiales bacterium]|nr:hypothetical protein [Hyphomicrobiales bacterium]MCP5370730.1 hypothetical protein [Hyphomicrobiales bacterium]